jgi:hypothetical protein
MKSEEWEGYFDRYVKNHIKRMEEWKESHADPLFGLPDDNYERLGSKFWRFSKVPFRPARSGTVEVMTLKAPTPERREIFQWLERNISSIRESIPTLLMEEAKSEGTIECYGEPDPTKAVAVFVPENICDVHLTEMDPGLWEIRAFHPTQQDVCITVRGSNGSVIRAFMFM